MRASTRVMLGKHLYWQDVARQAMEWAVTVALVWGFVYCVVDALFPNVPL